MHRYGQTSILGKKVWRNPNLKQKPEKVSADAGYFNEANVTRFQAEIQGIPCAWISIWECSSPPEVTLPS